MSRGSNFTIGHGDDGVMGRRKRILVKGLGSRTSDRGRFCACLGLEDVGILEGDALFSLDSVMPLGTTGFDDNGFD